jgi:hypothetical protein
MKRMKKNRENGVIIFVVVHGHQTMNANDVIQSAHLVDSTYLTTFVSLSSGREERDKKIVIRAHR